MKTIQLATDSGNKPTEIKTRIHNYKFYIDTEEDRIKYQEMVSKITVPKFACLADPSPRKRNEVPNGEITLETQNIFNNQWNTKCGFRVFDWFEPIYQNRSLKAGHYLEITPEMIDIREKTYKCGYCGAEYYGHENRGKFCSKCLDSPYLTEDYLHLLLLAPVSCESKKRRKLTDDEMTALMPIYIKRQTTGRDSRNAKKLKKQREDIQKEYAKRLCRAKEEHDGLIWLMDHNISIDNVIYYSHTNAFCFGWKGSLNDEVKKKLTGLLKDFPFNYELK